MPKFSITLLFTALISMHSLASEPTEEERKRCNDPDTKIECGWHFGYIDPLGELETKEEAPSPSEQPPAPEPEKPKESKEEKKPCSDKDTWSESCGFVDPGEDFDFQAMQRDIFLKGLLMKSHDPQAVENMQRYNKWLVTKAIEASKVWEFNLVQKPELSAAVNNPVNGIGVSMSLTLEENTAESVLQAITSEGGYFVWFTRSNCPYCHRQANIIKQLIDYDNIDVWNVSLDETCIEGFEDKCITAPKSTIPASLLNLKIVPSLFVYLPKDNTWIRVANGLESYPTIKTRVKNFFLAVKSAYINSIENGNGTIPSIDFSNPESKGFKGIATQAQPERQGTETK